MPELPEVELAARLLRREAIGHRIGSVDADASRVLRPAGRNALAPLVGGRFRDVRRIGKHLLVALDSARGPIGLHSHLGMTGKWVVRARGEEPPRFSRARIALDDGRVLHYADQRMFGRLEVVPRADFSKLEDVAALGPDPIEQGIDARTIHARLQRTRRSVKVALMDQSLIPGVGNIQASETLFRARIDPRRPASSITAAEANRIAAGVIASVKESLAHLEAQAGDVSYVEEGGPNPFAVYAREGERCPRCKRAKIERIVIDGRSTFFCPHCQK
jgi:formamidopyrimidine-DNA glycosylase